MRSQNRIIMRYFLLFTADVDIGSIWSFLILSSMFFLRDILDMVMNGSKMSLKLFLRSMDESPNSTYRNSQYITDFFIVASFDILQYDDFSLFIREYWKWILYSFSHVFLHKGKMYIFITLKYRTESLVFFIIKTDCEFCTFFTKCIDSCIMCNTINPRGKRKWKIILIDIGICFYKDILKYIFNINNGKISESHDITKEFFFISINDKSKIITLFESKRDDFWVAKFYRHRYFYVILLILYEKRKNFFQFPGILQ